MFRSGYLYVYGDIVYFITHAIEDGTLGAPGNDRETDQFEVGGSINGLYSGKVPLHTDGATDSAPAWALS